MMRGSFLTANSLFTHFSIIQLIILASLLSGCASATGYAHPDENFGFVLEFGSCGIDKLDTFKGEFTQDRVNEPDLTIPMQLSDDEMQKIYEGMVDIDLMGYPAVFKVPEPVFGEAVRISSPYYYALDLVNGDATQSIHWLDDLVKPSSPKADRLRIWFDGIIEIVQDHPEYQQLPRLNLGCI